MNLDMGLQALYIKSKLTVHKSSYSSVFLRFLGFFHIIGLLTSIFMRGDLGGER